MSLKSQQEAARKKTQKVLEQLHPGTVDISGEEYACASSGVRKRKFLSEGREIERRQMTLRLRKELYATEPVCGQVITFRDEGGVETEWRIAGLDGHSTDIAWMITCYEPSDERAS